ncbi:MAG: MFS transporter [Alphaproteobacteria bacterium]|nr:MFS transporter [Alphaproteobacteria bacterium]
MPRRGVVAWCLYDFANSTYPTIILTFVFAAYFTQGIAKSPEIGTSQWGYMVSVSALVVAVLSPVLGAIADRTGRRKPWLAGFSLLCIAATAALWFARPGPDYVLLALLLVGIGNIGFEIGMVFYNSMLNDLAPPAWIGRVSGWGWGIGYAGGLIGLAVALFVFVQPADPPFGLDQSTAEHVRATALLAAAWFAVFAIPLFLFTPDRPATGVPISRAMRAGIASVASTLRNVRAHRTIFLFLIARMFYIDGLTTLFAFGGIYAAGTFGLSLDEVIMFGIGLNVTAGLGAAVFAWFDDAFGPKPTIVISLIALIALGAGAVVVEDHTLFWILGLGLGTFVGPAQAASRSLMVRLVPPELETEMFGLYALAGKATAFLGPLVLALVTAHFDSQRAGMATILAFFAIGLVLLLAVRQPPPRLAA